MINCNEDLILVGKNIYSKDFAQKTINLKYLPFEHPSYVQTTIIFIFFYQFQHNTLFIYHHITMKNGISQTPE